MQKVITMKNIVLVGFMGTGKTRVGKILATQLKRQRLCLDDMIEWKIGKPITKIFEEDGESYFRKVESEVVKAASSDKNVVIDAGGGVVIDQNNIKRLKEHGVVICLIARPEVIYERTKGNTHRPLLNLPDPVVSIRELLGKRREHYTQADHTIDTSDITPEEIAAKILDIMEQKK